MAREGCESVRGVQVVPPSPVSSAPGAALSVSETVRLALKAYRGMRSEPGLAEDDAALVARVAALEAENAELRGKMGERRT